MLGSQLAIIDGEGKPRGYRELPAPPRGDCPQYGDRYRGGAPGRDSSRENACWRREATAASSARITSCGAGLCASAGALRQPSRAARALSGWSPRAIRDTAKVRNTLRLDTRYQRTVLAGPDGSSRPIADVGREGHAVAAAAVGPPPVPEDAAPLGSQCVQDDRSRGLTTEVSPDIGITS